LIHRAEACRSVGGAALAEAALERLGVDLHGATPDGRITVEPVFCLGLCACGPSVMVDDRVHGRVDADRLGAILEEVAP
jgi:formate dehydrogenase subunit gamma